MGGDEINVRIAWTWGFNSWDGDWGLAVRRNFSHVRLTILIMRQVFAQV